MRRETNCALLPAGVPSAESQPWSEDLHNFDRPGEWLEQDVVTNRDSHATAELRAWATMATKFIANMAFEVQSRKLAKMQTRKVKTTKSTSKRT